jgi:ferredoxin
MSKKDGKATLLGGENKKGFYTVRTENHEYDDNVKAANACPVNIIKVKMI